MTESALMSRTGAFWDFLAGRAPAPPAAAMLGWELSWAAPERGEIEVFFDARPDFTNPMGAVQGGFLAAMLDDTSARPSRPPWARASTHRRWNSRSASCVRPSRAGLLAPAG